MIFREPMLKCPSRLQSQYLHTPILSGLDVPEPHSERGHARGHFLATVKIAERKNKSPLPRGLRQRHGKEKHLHIGHLRNSLQGQLCHEGAANRRSRPFFSLVQ